MMNSDVNQYTYYEWGRVGLSFDGLAWQAWAEPFYARAPDNQFRHVSPDRDTAKRLCCQAALTWLQAIDEARRDRARGLPASPDAEAET